MIAAGITLWFATTSASKVLEGGYRKRGLRRTQVQSASIETIEESTTVSEDTTVHAIPVSDYDEKALKDRVRRAYHDHA